MSKHMDMLLKARDDQVSSDVRRLKALKLRAWGVHCVVMLAGSRPYGRPQGLVQAFSFSHFSSVLVRGFNHIWTSLQETVPACLKLSDWMAVLVESLDFIWLYRAIRKWYHCVGAFGVGWCEARWWDLVLWVEAELYKQAALALSLSRSF